MSLVVIYSCVTCDATFTESSSGTECGRCARRTALQQTRTH